MERNSQGLQKSPLIILSDIKRSHVMRARHAHDKENLLQHSHYHFNVTNFVGFGSHLPTSSYRIQCVHI